MLTFNTYTHSHLNFNKLHKSRIYQIWYIYNFNSLHKKPLNFFSSKAFSKLPKLILNWQVSCELHKAIINIQVQSDMPSVSV